jgi:hypothetical protein
MAERKFLYLSSEGYHQEHSTSTDELTIGGLTMNGAVDMQSSNKITNLGSATTSGDALAYGQSGANLSGLTLASNTDLVVSGGGEVTGLPSTPSGDTAAASKAYVDGVAAGLDWKESVRAGTTDPGTLATSFANGQTIDGVTLATNDRILIQDQSTGAENGLYIVQASGAPVRTDDLAAGDQAAGTAVFVEEGTANADSGFVCTNDGTSDTVGTHALVFTQFTGLGQITAGSGLTKTGNTLNVGAGNGISVAADTVAAAADTTSTTTTEANAIVVGANGISVKVDDSTIEGSLQGSAGAESLRLKDAGITGAKLSGSIDITTTGDITLNNPGELSVYGGITSTNGIFTGDGSGLTNLPGAASTDAVTVSAKKSTAGTINKGKAVYIVGYSSPDYTVELADADTSPAMPAIGIASSTITDSAAGTVVINGKIENMATDTWSAGDGLYVSTTAGDLTDTKPTGATNFIQKVAQVVVSDASTGIIQVFGAGRTNDVPNIAQDSVWIGNASGVATSTAIGNGLTSTPGTSLAVDPDSETGGNTEPVSVGSNGVGVNIANIAGTGLEADGSANLRIAAAAAGDGLEGGGGSALSVHLEATNPSLQISSDELGIKFNASGGLQKLAAGTGIKIDATEATTLALSSDGLVVEGLKSTFTIADSATGATVTAANLTSLTDTSNADSLHVHAAAPATEAPKVEKTVTVNEAISAYNVLAWSTGTDDRVAKGSASTDALARVVGVARTAQATPGQTCEMVGHGLIASALSAATRGAPVYLSSTGTLTQTIPSGGDRIILVGYATSATDLWVAIRDYGKSAS